MQLLIQRRLFPQPCSHQSQLLATSITSSYGCMSVITGTQGYCPAYILFPPWSCSLPLWIQFIVDVHTLTLIDWPPLCFGNIMDLSLKPPTPYNMTQYSACIGWPRGCKHTLKHYHVHPRFQGFSGACSTTDTIVFTSVGFHVVQ